MDKGYVTLARGVASPAAGSGEQSAPTSGETKTIWASNTNMNSAYAGTRWKRLILSIYSSHASATDGVKFEESADGTNWRSLVTYTLSATTYTKYIVAPAAPYVRVRFENSANTLTSWEMSLLGDTCERAAA